MTNNRFSSMMLLQYTHTYYFNIYFSEMYLHARKSYIHIFTPNENILTTEKKKSIKKTKNQECQ